MHQFGQNFILKKKKDKTSHTYWAWSNLSTLRHEHEHFGWRLKGLCACVRAWGEARGPGSSGPMPVPCRAARESTNMADRHGVYSVSVLDRRFDRLKKKKSTRQKTNMINDVHVCMVHSLTMIREAYACVSHKHGPRTPSMRMPPYPHSIVMHPNLWPPFSIPLKNLSCIISSKKIYHALIQHLF
jgi:hypothetical protein